jgi:type VI secretion system protein ImpC
MADEPQAGAAQPSVLDDIIQKGRMVRATTQEDAAKQQDRAKTLLGAFVNEVLTEAEAKAAKPGADAVARIQQRINEIDELIGKQLDEILHHPDFQGLEATWRGLRYLVMKTETGEMLKLRVMHASKADLHDDLDKAVEFDQSGLFKKVYEEEYGTFGGKPYSVLIGDYYFGRISPDIGLLQQLSGVAAAAHSPFIAAADPTMFDMDSFTDLGKPRDLQKIFESLDMIQWRSFRDSEDSRYVALTLPHILLRAPYHHVNNPVDGLNYDEGVDGRDAKKYLWGNAAWAIAERITHAFSLYKWCAAIRGVEGGGLVQGLPVHIFKTDEGDKTLKCPTEVAITDRREKELNDLGFISLVHCKDTDYAAFFGGHTTNKPILYDLDLANANARLSAMLPYLLAASRFAHYIKSIMRDKIGSFMTRGNVEEYLNRWISNYVLLNDGAPQNVKAQYPLREARVDVVEVRGKPGSYKATVFLKPHFQLEELTASIRLVADLPPPAAA